MGSSWYEATDFTLDVDQSSGGPGFKCHDECRPPSSHALVQWRVRCSRLLVASSEDLPDSYRAQFQRVRLSTPLGRTKQRCKILKQRGAVRFDRQRRLEERLGLGVFAPFM
jgi:hypothetical protein